jgi:hypothetical protein
MLTPKAVEATFGTTPNESWGSHGEQRGGNRRKRGLVSVQWTGGSAKLPLLLLWTRASIEDDHRSVKDAGVVSRKEAGSAG